MSNQHTGIEKGSRRVVFTIPDFDEFGELLHDRLHRILEHMEEISTYFMLITTLFDRDAERIEERRSKKMEDIESLVYSGTERQRIILEQKKPVNYPPANNKKNWDRVLWRKERNPYWNALQHQQMTRDMKGVETFKFFDTFRIGESKLSDIKIGSLKEYFSGDLNSLKRNEKPIISDYFDIEYDLYTGIPLLGLGKFQGIVWIVFKKEERQRFENIEKIKYFIKLFELVYTDLAYNSEISGKQSLIKKAIEETSVENPIYDEVKLNHFYGASKYYQETRIAKNDQTLNDIRSQLLRTATIIILLDSFAHNISAHSLTTLSWWFRERAEYLGEGRAILEAMGHDLNPLIRHSKASHKQENVFWEYLVDWVNERYQNLDSVSGTQDSQMLVDLSKILIDWQRAETENTDTFVKRTPTPTLSRELYPLVKFLLEKGAFWSGISRQTNFPGKISNLYNILWYDFINNPLYLGTIANTEEVLKLHICITIYEKEERVSKEDLFRNVKTIKRTTDGILLDGVFGTINLQDFSMESRHLSESPFIEKGNLYDALEKELKAIRIFLPGGVIGKHALFTLLENEIRNVKHFEGERLKYIQQHGLTLHISIHERPFDSEKFQPNIPDQLLKFGVWLNHPVDLSSDLLAKRIDSLHEDIIMRETAKPRLGGNFQDKIAASMLITGSFNRVQDNDSDVGKIYYPWVKTAGYHIPPGDPGIQRKEFEVSYRRYVQGTEKFEQAFAEEEGRGYLKKYFHIWKGADILSIDPENKNNDPADMENQGRYRFLHLQNAPHRYHEYKTKGNIRILTDVKGPQTVAEAYQSWLKKWMKSASGNRDMVVNFKENTADVGRLTYHNDTIRFENKEQIQSNYEDKHARDIFYNIPHRLEMAIAHGSHLSENPEKLNYRTDGELIRYFCDGKKMDIARMDDEGKMYELLEAFAAKICIFDKRVYNRIYSGDSEPSDHAKLHLQLKRLEMYRDHLRLDIRTESPDSWEAMQKQDFLSLHFLIVHLSFMESLGYAEEQTIEFIDEQILRGRPASSVGDDFILVMTTGRGREHWWEVVKKHPQYARFTTFRPIESILSTIEDAMQVADDFNLKFNLAKLLFGS